MIVMTMRQQKPLEQNIRGRENIKIVKWIYNLHCLQILLILSIASGGSLHFHNNNILYCFVAIIYAIVTNQGGLGKNV